jgi:hypothetical protein
MTPQADQWGWRHGPLRLMPPLAVFALDGDRELGQRVKAEQKQSFTGRIAEIGEPSRPAGPQPKRAAARSKINAKWQQNTR